MLTMGMGTRGPQGRGHSLPVHPLDEQGNSIAELEEAGKHEEAEQALLVWLDSTIQKLEGTGTGQGIRDKGHGTRV